MKKANNRQVMPNILEYTAKRFIKKGFCLAGDPFIDGMESIIVPHLMFIGIDIPSIPLVEKKYKCFQMSLMKVERLLKGCIKQSKIEK